MTCTAGVPYGLRVWVACCHPGWDAVSHRTFVCDLLFTLRGGGLVLVAMPEMVCVVAPSLSQIISRSSDTMYLELRNRFQKGRTPTCGTWLGQFQLELRVVYGCS